MAKNYKQTTDQNGNSTKKTTRKKKKRFPSSSKRTHLRTEIPPLTAQVSQRIW
ncbi:hypothetical protein ACTQ1W_03075 [Segatella copri]|uniref:Uncharacterized protein n=1 Tax=Segatella sinensis TaxID=3085167 RepID=A0ABV1FUY7_9BACT